ncbi:AfsR/SARP family transcriptional regulator [Micromonospora sp. NPDC002296]|uniref:AfsR/SARP family transcriptional regulator n=1 Tax=Micromonospora sp. NPDC002296 TaxID=3154271 RepID=UPI003318E831
MFAALLVDANCAVSVERLIDVVWDENPPATARQQIQNRLGKMRSFLLRGSSAQRIVRLGSSYTLEVPEDKVDGLRFRGLCAEAEAARRRQDLEHASALLRHGLDLWRGSAIQGVESLALEADARRWDEARLRAVEDVVDIDFARGRKVGMISDLHAWVGVYPYHEGLHCRFAEALYEAARTVESLTVLRDLKKRLSDELGIRPGPAVTRLERQILDGEGSITDRPRPLQIDRQAAEALRQALTETTRALAILAKALA